jgi:hypothetical protein
MNPDPHPSPHQGDKSDPHPDPFPDPHKCGADPQHCLIVRRAERGRPVVLLA